MREEIRKRLPALVPKYALWPFNGIVDTHHLSACCGAQYGLTTYPFGIGVEVSDTPIKDKTPRPQFTDVNPWPTYTKIEEESFPFGDGRYLNIRYHTLVSGSKCPGTASQYLAQNQFNDFLYQDGKDQRLNDPDVKHVYIVGTEYYTTFTSYGVFPTTSNELYIKLTEADDKEEIFKGVMEQFAGNYVIAITKPFDIDQSGYQSIYKRFMELNEDKILFKSKCFTNTRYNKDHDYLQLVLMKF